MTERLIFRALIALLVAAVGAVYAIVLARDNFGGRDMPTPGGSRAVSLEDALERLEWTSKPMPALSFQGPDGRDVALGDFRGKIVLLNFWATWCLPCLEEMPALDKTEAMLGGSDFAVIAVSLDRKVDDAKAWFRDNGIAHLELFHDGSAELWTALGMSGLPMSILVDREGREVARLARPAAWNSERALTILRDLIARPTDAQPAPPAQSTGALP